MLRTLTDSEHCYRWDHFWIINHFLTSVQVITSMRVSSKYMYHTVIEPQKWGPMKTGRATPGDLPRDRAGKVPRRCKAPREDRTG
jgi:hypothetical protein